MTINYRVGNPPTTEIPLDGQGKWLSFQEDGEFTVLAISGPRGGVLAQVRLDADLAELAASALLRTDIGLRQSIAEGEQAIAAGTPFVTLDDTLKLAEKERRDEDTDL